MDFEMTATVYTPRWGHDDTYTLKFSDEGVNVYLIGKGADWKYQEDIDSPWTGHNDWNGNALINILHEDGIYVDAVFQRAIEWLWRELRDGNTSESSVREAIQDLFDWATLIAKGKPNHPALQGFF